MSSLEHALSTGDYHICIVLGDGKTVVIPRDRLTDRMVTRTIGRLKHAPEKSAARKRYNEAHVLCQNGVGLDQIALRLGVALVTVENYLRCDNYDQWRSVYNLPRPKKKVPKKKVPKTKVPKTKVPKKKSRLPQGAHRRRVPLGQVCYKCGSEHELERFKGKILCSKCLVVGLEDDMEDARQTAFENAGNLPSGAGTIREWQSCDVP